MMGERCSVKIPWNSIKEVCEFDVPKRSLINNVFETRNDRSGTSTIKFSDLPFRSLSSKDNLQLTWNFEMTIDYICVSVHGPSFSRLKKVGGSCKLEFIIPRPEVGSNDGSSPPFPFLLLTEPTKGLNSAKSCFFYWSRGNAGEIPEWTDATFAIRVTMNLELISAIEIYQPHGMSCSGHEILPSVSVPVITNEAFFLSDLFSDVSVSSGAERWPAHKMVLAGGSEVFKRMLESDMKEVKEGQIRIPEDVDPNAVKQMLQFLYKGSCTFEGLNTEILLDLFKLSHVYAIEGLRVMAVSRIMAIITVDNAPKIYTLAALYCQNSVMDKALLVVKANRAGVSKNPEHLKELMETFPNFTFKLFNDA